MQRVRIGVTGLAVVFLLVLLTAALIGNLHRNAAPAGGAAVVQGSAADAAREPLAELGVAPGSTPTDANASAPLPTPVQHAVPPGGPRTRR